jgi:2-iminobutanoate/2-iminopropanoate deaminase
MPKREAIPFDAAIFVPISAAVRWGDLLFVSGIAAIDPENGTLLAEGIEEQCDIVLDSLERTIARAGTSIDQTLRLECYLSDASLFGAWNAAFAKRFSTHPPARTTLICGFALSGMLIEVQAVCGIEEAA